MCIGDWIFVGLLAAAFLWAMNLGWRLEVHLPFVAFMVFSVIAGGFVLGMGARVLKATMGW
jgi:hypothetical protein